MRIFLFVIICFGVLLYGCSKDGPKSKSSQVINTGLQKKSEKQKDSKESTQVSEDTTKSDQVVEADWKSVVENSKKYSVQGNVKILKDFPIKSLGRKRNIWLYLPESYNQTNKGYPVIYMQDGQSIFKSDDVEWKVDETLSAFTKEKKVPEVIVVGIESDPKTRFNEYAPWKNPVGDGGEGDLYADFLAKELKPYIDQHYRTLSDLEHTAIAGGSMGGYISLYTAIKYPNLFGKVAAFSPIIGFNKPPYMNFIQNQTLNQHLNVYIDAGENEVEFPNAATDVKEVDELLLSKGLNKENINLVIDKEGQHDKASWSKRFPNAMEWLLNKI
jgi:predicted alpha/beta superfamily hydrolase